MLVLLAHSLGHIAAFALRLSAKRAGVVLVYHGLTEDETGKVQLVRPHRAEVLDAQLRYLSSRFRVVPAENIVEAVEQRRRGDRFPVAVTFDDDLESHVKLALPVLRRVGVPATFFLCGVSLDSPHTFWWQHLQRAADSGLPLPLAGRDIHDVAEQIESMSPADRSRVEEALAQRMGPGSDEPGLRRSDVRELVEHGLRVGFHTLRHDRLTELDDLALAAALTDGRPALEDVVGRALTMVAYPHGKADARVGAAAREAGFRLGFTGRAEPVTTESDTMLLGRLEPAHDSVAGLAFQLARTVTRVVTDSDRASLDAPAPAVQPEAPRG